MKKLFTLCLSIFILFFTNSCRYDFNFIPRDYNVLERSPSFTKLEGEFLPPTADNGKFSILLISDTHFGRDGWFKPPRKDDDFYEKLESVAKSFNEKGYPLYFAINSGDVVDTGLQSEYDTNKVFENKILSILKNYNNQITKEKIIYSVVGNHDLYNNKWPLWKKNIFPYTSTYYFSIKNLSFYFLDSASGVLGENQLTQFEQLLKNDKNKKIVVSHYPYYIQTSNYYSLSNPLETAKMIKLFAQNDVIYSIEGHFHLGGEKFLNNGKLKDIIIPGFVDKRYFYVLQVDLSDTNPKIIDYKYKY